MSTATLRLGIIAVLATVASVSPAALLDLEGDARSIDATTLFSEPGASVASFVLVAARSDGDLRAEPGLLLLVTAEGMLVAETDANTRRFDPWHRDVNSGRPLRRDAAAGAECPTGGEPECWRPGDPVPYSSEVAAALGVANRIPNLASPAPVVLANQLSHTPIPLVPLNTDPCDAFSPGRPCAPAPQPSTVSTTLDDAQQALLGCGPFYGTDCESDGIDLLNVEASVLMQSFVGFGGSGTGPAPSHYSNWFYGKTGANGVPLPQPGTFGFQGGPVGQYFQGGQNIQIVGGRGPTDPGYDPLTDGSIAFAGPKFGQCAGVTSLAIPCNDLTGAPLQNGGYLGATGQYFTSEMAALSFNFQNLLVAFSVPSAAAIAGGIFQPTELDPNDPFSSAPQQCSYRQPQYCSNVRSLFSLQSEPLADDPNATATHWIWEAGAEYRVVGAWGDLARYAGGSAHVLGVERSRTRSASLGVPLALFRAPGTTLDPSTPFAITPFGDAPIDHGFAYLSAPEPANASLALAAFSALTALARRRSRKAHSSGNVPA